MLTISATLPFDNVARMYLRLSRMRREDQRRSLTRSFDGCVQRAKQASNGPFLWFDGTAEEAMNHYVTIFRNSKIEIVSWGTRGLGKGPSHVRHIPARWAGSHRLQLRSAIQVYGGLIAVRGQRDSGGSG